MRTLKLIIASISIVLLVNACNCGAESKADKWSDENKTEWTDNCMKFMKNNGVEEKNATDFCDCMLKKTSEKYTPEEAANITEEEERKLWEDCDYTW